MSRKSKSEYIGEKRRACEKAGKAKRSRILDEVCETLTERYKKLNGVQLYRQVVRRLKRILRRQEAWRSLRSQAWYTGCAAFTPNPAQPLPQTLRSGWQPVPP